MATKRALWLSTLVFALAPACKDKPAETSPDAAPSAPASVAAQASASAKPPSPAASASATPDDPGRRAGPRWGGLAGSFFFAAKSLPEVKDELKAKVDAAERSLRGGEPAAREAIRLATKELHAEIAAGIKGGKIDAAKLQPKYVEVEKALKAQRDKETEALAALYELLSPEQRKEVASQVRAQHAAREEQMAKRAAEREKAAAARAAADGGVTEDAGAASADRRRRGFPRSFTRDLELDAEQEKKVAALAARLEKDDAKTKADRAAMKKRLEAALAAFEAEAFDAKKLELDAKTARAPLEEETKRFAQLLPILKPEQREKLAARVEKGPQPHRRMGPLSRHPAPGDDQDDDDD